MRDLSIVLEILSDEFKVAYSELQAPHDENYGIGEITRAYLLAKASGADPKSRLYRILALNPQKKAPCERGFFDEKAHRVCRLDEREAERISLQT
jgi:hypothetical protein